MHHSSGTIPLGFGSGEKNGTMNIYYNAVAFFTRDGEGTLTPLFSFWLHACSIFSLLGPSPPLPPSLKFAHDVDTPLPFSLSAHQQGRTGP